MSQYTPGSKEPSSFGKSSDVSDKAKETAAELKAQTKQTMKNVGERVKQSAKEVGKEARSAVQEQKDILAQKVESLASAVHDTANRLRGENTAAGFAGFVDQAADQMERLSHFIREQEMRDMIDNIQDWARKNPALFLGGSFVLGMVAARFFKGALSSPEHSGEFSGSYDSPYDLRGSGSVSPSGQYGESAFSSAGAARPTEPDVTGTAGSWEEP